MTAAALSPNGLALNSLAGASIAAVEADLAARYWDWAVGDSPAPDLDNSDPGLHWLHATLDDGVVWGRLDGSRWRTAAEFGGIVPQLRSEALWELRLFGPQTEVLLWPDDDGTVIGRQLTAAPVTDPTLVPIEAALVVVGDRVRNHPANGRGFTLVADATGSRQVVPLDLIGNDFLEQRGGEQAATWPLRLTVRHHLQADPANGGLRIGATRWCWFGLARDEAPRTHPEVEYQEGTGQVRS